MSALFPRAYADQVAANTVAAAGSATPAAGSIVASMMSGTGEVAAASLGLTAYNNTGSTLTPGQLVYVSGWNAGAALPEISLGDCVYGGQAASYVVTAAIVNHASGVVSKGWISSASLNTGGAAIGDWVYQGTAGGFLLNAPTLATQRIQPVGQVKVVSASVGVIAFNLPGQANSQLSSNDLQAGAAVANVGAGLLTPDKLGMQAYNGSGTTMTAGTLVYVSGWNTAGAVPSLSRADGHAANARATYVVTADIANLAIGTVAKRWLSAANLNTNSASGVGALVYSDTSNGTIGGWIVATPGYRWDIVGVVVVKSATVGQIFFDLTGTHGTQINGITDIVAASIGSASVANGAVTSALCDPTVVQTATVTLTNSDIKNLRATPKTLVAAQGLSTFIEFLGATILLKAGANVLTESTANLAVRYTNGSGTQISETVETTGFIDQSVDTLTTCRPKQDGIVATSQFTNALLCLHNEGAGEYAGNAAADATLRVKVAYRVWPTT